MSTTRMAEIVVSWGEALLDVQHVRPRPDEPVPLDAPVIVTRAGRLCCLSPEGARRSLVTRGAYRSHGDTEAVRELDALSGGVLVLADGESARVEVGALTYEVRPTAPATKAPRAKGSRALRVALLGALVLHAPLFIALALAPPRAAALTLHREPVPARLIALLPEPEIADPEGALDLSEVDPRRYTVPYRPPMWGDSQTADPIETAYFWRTGGNTPHTVIGDPAWRDRYRSSCGVVTPIRSLCALMRDGCRSRVMGPAPHGVVRPGRVEVYGATIPRESVRRVVRQHLAEVRFCYEQGLRQTPTLEGRVEVRFIIGTDGRVMSAAIGSSDLRSAAVEQCIASAVRRWTFPSRDELSGVSYAFVLETSDSDLDSAERGMHNPGAWTSGWRPKDP